MRTRRLSGRLRSAMIIGGQGIRARKLRTLLSMISLFLGVMAVVVVQAGAETAKRAMLATTDLEVGIDGTRQMFLPPQGREVVQETLRGRSDAVAVTNAQVIIGEPGVSPINPGGASFDQVESRGAPEEYVLNCDKAGNCRPVPRQDQGVRPPGQAIELQLNTLSGDIRQFRPFRTVSGQWLDFGSAPSLSPRLVLNKEAAKGFSRYRVPAEMRLDNATAHPTPQIVGIVDDGQPQPVAYVRDDEMGNWLPGAASDGNRGDGVQVLLSPDAADVEQLLRARLVGAGVPAEAIHIQTIDTKKQMARQLALIRWIFLGMASLVLLIGVAGILNVGLATVGERIEEFALRRAVGTPRSLLAGIVLAETLLTGLLTAAAAIGVAAAVIEGAGQLIDSQNPLLRDLQFPWQAGVAGIIAGLVAGVLGGLIPAIRAARIPIATVMRA